MVLLLHHPDVAYRSCSDCQRFIYDDRTGKVRRTPSTQEPIERPPGSRPSCYGCPKVSNRPAAERTPDSGTKATLSRRNWQTLTAYWEVQASRVTIEDRITQRNFGLIAQLLNDNERNQRQSIITLTTALAHART
jgi:hypothetical protein